MTTAQEAFEKAAKEEFTRQFSDHGYMAAANWRAQLDGFLAGAKWKASRHDCMEMIAELVGAAKALEPYTDAIICYASTMDEHEPNRLVFNLRAALTKAEKFMEEAWREVKPPHLLRKDGE